jgi:hypothetical protein
LFIESIKETYMKTRTKKTARQDKTGKHIIIFYLLSLIFYLTTCEQASGPRVETEAQNNGEKEDEPEWWEEWEEPEEEELPPPEITGISVKKPNLTFYARNQVLEEGQGYWDGLEVYWDYSDGHRVKMAEGEYTLTPDTVDTGEDGSLDIEVRAGNCTAYFGLYVSRSTSVLQSISVKNAPAEFSFLGEPLNTAGMAIEGTYNDKTADISLSAVSVEGYDRLKRADQTVTLRINDKTTTLVVRPRIKPGSKFWANEYGYSSSKKQLYDVKPVYIKGKEFDLAGSNLKAWFRMDWGSPFTLTLTPGNGLYPEDITGYDKDKAGKQILTLSLDGVDALRTFPVYVMDTQPDVWFDYGFMRHAGDPEGVGAGFGTYHVEQGKPLVLAPVRYLIGWNDDHTPAPGTTYHWTVEGGNYGTAQPHNGEFFTFTPAAAGTYTVRVTVSGRNYIDGSSVTKTAKTEVVSFAPGTTGTAKAWGEEKKAIWEDGNSRPMLRNFAPGQFVNSGTGYGWSLGTIGGYVILKADPANLYGVGGNAFGTWFEPGIVWMMEDNNGNGVPDEMWYEIKGPNDLVPKYQPYITRRYAIRFADGNEGSHVNEYGQTIRNSCWTDCKGRSGLMGGGWPSDWGVTGDWVTYTSTLIDDVGDIANGTGGGHGVTTTFRSLQDEKTGHYLTYVDADRTVFYASDAMDAQGNPVPLSNVHFLKVHTAAFQYGGIFGEYSTEVTYPAIH